jgi:hypothetical protein
MKLLTTLLTIFTLTGCIFVPDETGTVEIEYEYVPANQHDNYYEYDYAAGVCRIADPVYPLGNCIDYGTELCCEHTYYDYYYGQQCVETWCLDYRWCDWTLWDGFCYDDNPYYY